MRVAHQLLAQLESERAQQIQSSETSTGVPFAELSQVQPAPHARHSNLAQPGQPDSNAFASMDDILASEKPKFGS